MLLTENKHTLQNWQAVVCIVIRLQAGWPRCESQQRQAIFLFSRISRQAVGCTQPPIQWVL